MEPRIKQGTGKIVVKNIELRESQIYFNSVIHPSADKRTSASPVPRVTSQKTEVGKLKLPEVAASCGWQSCGPERSFFERREIFNTVWNTMLHDPDCYGGAKYPCQTYGFFTVDGQASRVLERDACLHWEEKAIAALTASIEDGGLRGSGDHRVVFYMNWSPCPMCVQGLVRFLQWSKREGVVLRLTLKVAALFHITWPECEARGCSHLDFARHVDAYLEGVRQLFRHDVKVEAFTQESWGLLRRVLGLPDTAGLYSTARQRTDTMLQLSLRAIRESA